MSGKSIFFVVSIVFVFLSLMQMKVITPNAAEPTIITLTAIAGVQYDLVRFAIKPGTVIKVILKNSDDMSHNLVFTKPGKRLDVVNAALKLEEKGPEMNYIPKSTDVLWSIPVLYPGEENSVTFTAPNTPATYPYVCTFPGHGFLMFGAMYVTLDGKLPPIDNDPNVPLSKRTKTNRDTGAADNTHAVHSQAENQDHPYDLNPPFLYRAYMKNSSPASIAVHLPHQLSYCWDAEACELRYAWEGKFVDNTGLWKGKPNAVAKVLGTIYYENKLPQPIRMGSPERLGVVEFKGYQLRNRYPEFRYSIDGVDVFEMIQTTADGNALVRKFRIPSTDKNVWFCAHPQDGVSYESSAGKMIGNKIMIPREQAREFSIVMTKRETGK